MRGLPAPIQKLAAKNFHLLKKNVKHPSLHLKKIDKYWSVRIGIRHHALAVECEQGLLWFWIGSPTKITIVLFTRQASIAMDTNSFCKKNTYSSHNKREPEFIIRRYTARSE